MGAYRRLRGTRTVVGTDHPRANHIARLRAAYRSRWDAHQILADQNVRLTQAGRQPTNEQLINEQRAAEAVQRAREELRAAMASGGG
jgi:hypothetical protein